MPNRPEKIRKNRLSKTQNCDHSLNKNIQAFISFNHDPSKIIIFFNSIVQATSLESEVKLELSNSPISPSMENTAFYNQSEELSIFFI